MQYRLRRHDGAYRWILDIGTPEWDAAGRFQGYIGSCVDITEARRVGLSSAVQARNGAVVVPDESLATLTRREHDVLELLARALSNREIAGELIISVATVRVHVDHILDKLGLHSRAQVAAWAVRQPRS
jgi:DNA-binding NarL/FixJ family response regulator